MEPCPLILVTEKEAAICLIGMASRLQATFVFMRYKRRIGGKTIFIAKETTFGSLAVQWAKKEPEKYPAGVSFFDESGELSGELHPEGDATYTVVFDDRDDTLREICEKAAQVHKKILKAGRSDREDASARDYGWGVVYAPHDFGQDGRFQRAGEPDAFWVEFRESFDKLEAKLYELLFSPAPSKNECLLCGPAGTGKSHAVMAVVNSLMRKAHARMEESKEQTGEGGPAEAKRYRVVPILDCRKLVLDFTATVATGLATAFGNDELALDEICQLQTAAQFRSFLSRQSAQVLFVLDQYQYVVEHGNDSLKESLNKLLYGQRALFVTSAGSNEVKELVTKSHKYQEWVQLEPALTEVNFVH